MSEIEQLYLETQMMEEFVARLGAEMQSIAANVSETTGAIEAIKSLRDCKKSEILLQLGTGAMLRTRMSSVESIPVNVGAGVVVEKSPNDAINYLEVRMKEMRVSLEDMAAQRQQAVMNVEQKRRRLEELAKSAQPAPGT